MIKRYIKNNIVKSAFEIIVIKDGMQTINPSEEQILADGWVEYIPQVVIPQLDYHEEVNTLIREKYSLSEELSILRQKDEKPQEYQEYFDYCEKCKSDVKAKLKI